MDAFWLCTRDTNPDGSPFAFWVIAEDIVDLARAWEECKRRRSMLRIVQYKIRHSVIDTEHSIFVNPDYITYIDYAPEHHRTLVRASKD